MLDSRDSAAVADLMHKLQGDLQVKSTTYSVSHELKNEVQERLIAEALGDFQERAALIAKGLGYSKYRLVDVSVVTAGNGSPRPMRAMAMAAEANMSAPVLEAGWSEVSVTVAGTIEMQVTP